jgi:hypothetical protein
MGEFASQLDRHPPPCSVIFSRHSSQIFRSLIQGTVWKVLQSDCCFEMDRCPHVRTLRNSDDVRRQRNGDNYTHVTIFTIKLVFLWVIYDNTTRLYWVFQEEMSVFWEVIVSIILRKKVYMYVCPIPNDFRDRVISLYSSKLVFIAQVTKLVQFT